MGGRRSSPGGCWPRRAVSSSAFGMAAGQPWDSHSDIKKNHGKLGMELDKFAAALIKDLKRGMLDDTLVIFGGEFGRTPVSEGGSGRDHNPYGFTYWLAGGGVKGGHVHGATDDFGFRSVAKDVVHVHDLHATILHPPGHLIMRSSLTATPGEISG